MLGKHHSPETREKLRQAHLGMKASEETRRKMSQSSKVPNSGQFPKGMIPKNKGKGRQYEGNKECPVCHKIFHFKCIPYKRNNGYIGWGLEPDTCSKECRYESARISQEGIERPHMQGENSYLWKGGITKLTHKIRRSLKYTIYRRDCFRRDKWICQICYKKASGHIEMDHIFSFARIMEFYQIKTFKQSMECKKLWDLDNVRTLCHECHIKTESYMTPIEKHAKLEI